MLNIDTDFLTNGFTVGNQVSSDLLTKALNEVPFALEWFSSFRADTNSNHEDIAIPVTGLFEKLSAASALQKEAKKFASTLIGKEPELVSAQLVVRKRGAEGVPFHVDGNRTVKNWSEMPFCQVIVGISLVDISETKCGNLLYKGGSHHSVRQFIYSNYERMTELPKVDAFREIFKLSRELEIATTAVTCKQGEMVAMHSLLVHGVDENINADRPAWYFRFGNPSMKKKDGFQSAFPCKDWPIMCD